MTLDEAVTEIVAKTPLEPRDISDLLDVSNDPGGIELLMRVYQREGRGPDLTQWQIISSILSTVSEIAIKVAPIVSVIATVAPLL